MTRGVNKCQPVIFGKETMQPIKPFLAKIRDYRACAAQANKEHAACLRLPYHFPRLALIVALYFGR